MNEDVDFEIEDPYIQIRNADFATQDTVRLRSASTLGPITLCLEPRSDYGLPRTSVRVRSASNPGPITVCLDPRSDYGVPRTPVNATMPDPKLQIQNAEFETQDPGDETSDSQCRV